MPSMTCRWYCHFDDDEYVNVGALVELLSRYSPERERVYIGHTPPRKPWTGHPEPRKEVGLLSCNSDNYVIYNLNAWRFTLCVCTVRAR